MDDAVRDYLRAFTILAVCAFFAISGLILPMPWSPLGQAQENPPARDAAPPQTVRAANT